MALDFFPTTAEALTVLMLRKNLTGRELAARSGLHVNTVSAYLRSKLWPATLRTITKLAVALDVEPSWLDEQVRRDLTASITKTLDETLPSAKNKEAPPGGGHAKRGQGNTSSPRSSS